MFTPEFKAAQAECLRIAKALYFYWNDEQKRKELQKQLEAARKKKEEAARK